MQGKYGGTPRGCNASRAEVEEGTARMTDEGRCWEDRKELGGYEADGEEISRHVERGDRTGREHSARCLRNAIPLTFRAELVQMG